MACPANTNLPTTKTTGPVESATSTVETLGTAMPFIYTATKRRHTFTGYSKDAKLENEARYYHTEGYVEETRQYSAGEPVGETRLFYADGTLKGTIRMPKNETTDTLYMDLLRRRQHSRVPLQKGERQIEGINRLYFLDGSLKLEVAYSIMTCGTGKRSEYYETGGCQSIRTLQKRRTRRRVYLLLRQRPKKRRGHPTKTARSWANGKNTTTTASRCPYNATMTKPGNLTKSESWDDLGNLDEVQELDGNASGTVKLYGKGGKVHSGVYVRGKR